MLFANIYTWKGNLSEESQKRIVNLFTKWAPPAGVEIKSHYVFGDGSGGVTISEVSTAAAGDDMCRLVRLPDQRIVALVDARKLSLSQ